MHLQSSRGGDFQIKKPCCSPAAYRPLDILHLDQVVLRWKPHGGGGRGCFNSVSSLNTSFTACWSFQLLGWFFKAKSDELEGYHCHFLCMFLNICSSKNQNHVPQWRRTQTKPTLNQSYQNIDVNEFENTQPRKPHDSLSRTMLALLDPI